MKRTLIAFMLMLAAAIAASARAPLEISQIFNGKYASDPQVTETMISGDHNFLKKHKLTMFCTFKAPAEKYAGIIEPMVLADGAKAVGRNIRYDKGKLHYAFFMLSPTKEGGKMVNRFLYYLNNEPSRGENLMVLYFEGAISQSLANALIKKMTGVGSY